LATIGSGGDQTRSFGSFGCPFNAEALIDDARRENVFGLLMSLNMLIEFGDAFDYSASDFRKWCGEVGFNCFDVINLAAASGAAIAYK
jgi:hypothetical protein